MMFSECLPALHAKYDGEDFECQSFSTDTRSIKAGDIFVALIGENFDGHDFVGRALEQGAVAAIVSDDYFKKADSKLKNLVGVQNTLKAYGQVAACYAASLRAKKAAITGSCGKTSVKEMLSSILSAKGSVLATQSNFNNEVGVPRTLLEINPQHDYAVVEMGARKKGDIAYLSDLVSADVVTVLNADRAHLEGFGSVDDVAEAKGEIFSGARESGTAVLSLDEKYFSNWEARAKKSGLSLVTTSLSDNKADIFLEESQFTGKGFSLIVNVYGTVCDMSLPLLGEHNIKNALIAIGIAHAFGLTTQEIATGLAKVKAVKGRLSIVYLDSHDSSSQRQTAVIDDSYNANPLSVKAAVDVLSQYREPRILVLGDMAELGEEEEALHQEIGLYIKEKGIDVLLTCGVLSKASFNQFSGEGKAYSDQKLLLAELGQWLEKYPGGVFLVKGSRSAAMENVSEALVKCGEAA